SPRRVLIADGQRTMTLPTDRTRLNELQKRISSLSSLEREAGLLLQIGDLKKLGDEVGLGDMFLKSVSNLSKANQLEEWIYSTVSCQLKPGGDSFCSDHADSGAYRLLENEEKNWTAPKLAFASALVNAGKVLELAKINYHPVDRLDLGARAGEFCAVY